MIEAVFFLAGLLVGAIGAWIAGKKKAGQAIQNELESLTRGLRAGNLPDPERASQTVIPEVQEVRKVLSDGWAPRPGGEGDETRQALLRIAEFLRHRVESPLLAGLEGGGGDLRDQADAALGAVEDLEFFLEDPPSSREPEIRNLTQVAQEVTREFASQSSVLVKVQAPQEPIRIRVEPEPLKDAIFLILHNAAEFGGEQPLELNLGTEGGKAYLKVRDKGPGFSAEALLKAMNPFYSTSPGGLGLGLPHARRAVNGQGGEVFLRNGEGGGAEVEIQLPLGD
ncbi:MAG: HAMP domain-containing histidine kinase [Gemmatimonadetes bacterium]|nr:HAMP domain-containing histidine kinase [Gemmatimonadota bacterium]NNM07272.1 HAMP domain-containing histidine kinase [Gemmatimonadota bacterium]